MRSLLLITFVSLTAVANAQVRFKTKTDSLENLLKQDSLKGTSRIDVTNKLASYLAQADHKRAIRLANEAYAASIKAHHTDGLAMACLNKGISYQFIGELDSALVYADRGLRDLPSLPKRVIETGVCYLIKAHVYRRQNKTSAAITAFMAAIKYYEKAGYEYGVADCYIGIASMLIDARQFERAITYHQKALDLYTKLGNKHMISLATGNIGMAYQRLKKYDEALRYHYRSLAIIKGENDSSRTAYIYNDLGATYREMKNAPKAISFLQKSAELRRKTGEIDELAYTLEYLGEAYELAGDKTRAITYIKQAHALAVKMKHTLQIKESFKSISDFYARNRQPDSAYFYVNKFNSFKDSVEAADNKKELNALTTRYETQKKEQQIALLNKQATINKMQIARQRATTGVVIGVFVAALIFGLLILNRNKLKQKAALQQEQLTNQHKLTKAVIDAEERERKRIASDLHDGVGQLFSAAKMNLGGLLDRIRFDKDEDRFLAEKTLSLVEESCKEVRVISHQMMPNMLLRSGIASDVKSFIEKIDAESLKVNVEATGFKDRLESNVEIVLYRVIQETVNNVIKHARASRLDISLGRDETGITAVVTDNGVGFDTGLIEDHGGIGLKNIAARIEYLKGAVRYESAPDRGTSVKIWAPVT